MNGKAAAFGGRMMQTVADQILGQFAGNFAALVVARSGQAADAAPAEAAGDAQAADAPGIASSGTAQSQAPTPAAEPAAAPHAAELNGLALLWAVLRDWLRGLFSRKTA